MNNDERMPAPIRRTGMHEKPAIRPSERDATIVTSSAMSEAKRLRRGEAKRLRRRKAKRLG